ncbi:putative E3 ubiquitin-protein ligase RING1a [Impatiens glandulifera]|uniref:putative E3 ubiquitin-protein ligase RING1a n=1 Tax=Impatiens glandulifera TaxID=253017 RepID=UPI001FB13BD7|nr:putative E3 ubiquitin-protein ligase RING1a [Impatiens glandulifera]
MSVQKRHSSSSEELHDEDSSRPQQSIREKSQRDRGTEEKELKDEVSSSEGEDSDGNRSSDDDLTRLSEWIPADLLALRSYVQCPICLGIIKKTRTVMECLHRFCRECIDKSMRMGNNECPACRTHCASRRSLRDDPRFDAMIAVLYHDIKKYEEEELAFHDEEKTRNKQIQESIAQTFQRQAEALAAKRNKPGKDVTTIAPRLQHNYRHSYSRRRRNRHGTEHEGSDENEEENNHDGNKNSSSADERGRETKRRRCKRRIGAQPLNSDSGCIDNDMEVGRESKGVSSPPFLSSEILGCWGAAGARSRSIRTSRLTKLKGYLENSKQNGDKLNVHIILISLDTKQMPCLKQPYLYCPPSFLVEHLNDYVARDTKLQAEDVEILLVKKSISKEDSLDLSMSIENISATSELLDLCEVGLQPLQGKETIGELRIKTSSDIMSHLNENKDEEAAAVVDKNAELGKKELATKKKMKVVLAKNRLQQLGKKRKMNEETDMRKMNDEEADMGKKNDEEGQSFRRKKRSTQLGNYTDPNGKSFKLIDPVTVNPLLDYDSELFDDLKQWLKLEDEDKIII